MSNIVRYLVSFMAVVAMSLTGVEAQSYSVPKATETLSAMGENELWDRGNTSYVNDNFVDAERYYNEILERGLYSSALYYNLGNVHHKRGEVGRSLLYYHKALRLSPSDRDILHNIEIAEAKTKDNIERIPTLFIVDWNRQVGALMGCLGWSVMSLVMLGVLLLFAMLYLLADNLTQRRIGFWTSLIFATLFVLSTHYALEDRSEMLNPSEAIVMSRSMSVKSSPSASSTELFILHEGTKVRVVTSLEEWSEVVLSDGKSGWVESQKIEKI